jgi:4-azaleucine resistance transporter AzlC
VSAEGRQGFVGGVREALPVVLGYLPIGFAYGVLAVAAGIPLWATVLMSVIVFAGSAQFIAVSLLEQGVPLVSLVATTFLVNVRHLLYGLGLSPYLRPMSRGRLAWLAAELTDETFVMASRAAGGRRRSLGFAFVAGLNGTAQLSWVAGSLLGAAAGSLVGDPTRFGLDYALVSMFLGLLALQMHGLREVVVAGAAGAVAIGFWFLELDTLGVVVATLAASALGLLVPGGGAVEELPGEREAP